MILIIFYMKFFQKKVSFFYFFFFNQGAQTADFENYVDKSTELLLSFWISKDLKHLSSAGKDTQTPLCQLGAFSEACSC